MKLYGMDLLWFGIVLLVIAVVITIVFICIYRIRTSELKKQLEKEYGPEPE